MSSRNGAPPSADTIHYVADMLAELRRLAVGHDFLAYLITMAQVEAKQHALLATKADEQHGGNGASGSALNARN